MPGFTSHYLFGLDIFNSLNSKPLKKLITQHRTAYNLGLQGPDIFFYYLPSYLIHENNMAAVAHVDKINLCLHYLLKSQSLFTDMQQVHIAQAYILGFISHYLLDCHCHPYIYDRSNYKEKNLAYHGRHMELETEIDSSLLSIYLRCPAAAFPKSNTIALRRTQQRTIALILHYVYAKAYPELKISLLSVRLGIRSMQLGTRLFHDPYGWKKNLFRMVERLILGYPVLSSMIPGAQPHLYQDPLNMQHHKWKNPWQHTLTSTASFLDLIQAAKSEYFSLLPVLETYFTSARHKDLRQSKLNTLLTVLGDNSYHTGLLIRD